MSNDKNPSTIQTMVVLTDSVNMTEGGNLAIYQSNANVIPTNELRSEGIDPNILYGSMMSFRTWAFTINGTTYDTTNYTVGNCAQNTSSQTCLDADDLSEWLSTDQPQSIQAVDSYLGGYPDSDITAHISTERCLINDYYWEHIQMGDCLVIPTKGRCQLLYNPPIGITIVLTATIKVAAMFLAAKLDRHRSAPLLTIGDAVASFLTRPDPTTMGMCWLSKSDVPKTWRQLHTPAPDSPPGNPHLHPRPLPPRRFWYQAASLPRWGAT
ncbi:hypothetical protein BO78DRAFT_441621, partial [Aspergillus sclerotiicarbonarius CBS 121057]